MVDYNAFYVDPRPAQQQSFNNLAGSIQYKNAMQRQARQDEMNQQQKTMKLLSDQMNFIGQGLDSVTDEQSHQNFMALMGQLDQSGMFNNLKSGGLDILSMIPQHYDPQKVEQGKKLINSFRQKVSENGFTLGAGQNRYDNKGNIIAKGPEKQESESGFTLGAGQNRYDNKGNIIAKGPERQETETSDLKNYRAAVKEGFKGNFQDWMKNVKRGEDISNFTQEQIDIMGANYNLTGKLPPMGMRATALRQAILKSATEQALNSGKTAGDIIGGQADVKAISGSLAQQEKQLGAMGSFAKNLSEQVDRVSILANDLKTFDSRLLNIPLRALRGRLAGSPLQAKYDMYLTEIESEIGKLATGSTASIAELSQGAQERWSRIHDKNLSITDMQELLKETKKAADIRIKSVEKTIDETRSRLRAVGTDTAKGQPSETPPMSGAEKAPDGNWYIKQGGKYFRIEQE